MIVPGLTAPSLARHGDRITVEVLGRRIEVWATPEGFEADGPATPGATSVAERDGPRGGG